MPTGLVASRYGMGTEIYKFEKIKRAKRQALADFPDRQLLDFGIGENDAMAPETVRRRMAEEINQPENRGYADNGILEFKQAVARFMRRMFGVELDAATRSESLHRLQDGSGDVARLLHQSGRHHADDRARLSGGRHAHALLRRSGVRTAAAARKRLLPDLKAIPRDISPEGQAAGSELPQQSDGQGRHASVLRAGDRLRAGEPDRGRAGRGPHPVDL